MREFEYELCLLPSPLESTLAKTPASADSNELQEIKSFRICTLQKPGGGGEEEKNFAKRKSAEAIRLEWHKLQSVL